jgi:hypothetical protein
MSACTDSGIIEVKEHPAGSVPYLIKRAAGERSGDHFSREDRFRVGL